MKKTTRRWINASVPYMAGAAFAAASYVAYRLITRKVKEVRSPGPMTPATTERHAAETPIGPPGRNDEDRLDEALQESFPTSDPVSIQVSHAPKGDVG